MWPIKVWVEQREQFHKKNGGRCCAPTLDSIKVAGIVGHLNLERKSGSDPGVADRQTSALHSDEALNHRWSFPGCKGKILWPKKCRSGACVPLADLFSRDPRLVILYETGKFPWKWNMTDKRSIGLAINDHGLAFFRVFSAQKVQCYTAGCFFSTATSLTNCRWSMGVTPIH